MVDDVHRWLAAASQRAETCEKRGLTIVRVNLNRERRFRSMVQGVQ
jgi:hypothetical protein